MRKYPLGNDLFVDESRSWVATHSILDQAPIDGRGRRELSLSCRSSPTFWPACIHNLAERVGIASSAGVPSELSLSHSYHPAKQVSALECQAFRARAFPCR